MGALDSAASGAATGAAIGSIIPGLGTIAGGVIGGVAGLVPSVFKFFSGKKQKAQANAINPVNPGYQQNQGALQNAQILRDRYSNYTMPGYSQAQDAIDRNSNNAFYQGVQGASSGGDVADLAAKLAYGSNVANANLEAQNSAGKENALGQYLQANQVAGQEAVNQNAYDRSEYDRLLARKDALNSAGNTNEYNALDTGASVLSSYLSPKSTLNDNTNNKSANSLGSIFSSSSPNSSSGVNLNPYADSTGSIDWGKMLMQNRY